jgi:hypothetical protein
MTELPRADRRLTLHERSRALQRLDELAFELNDIATWLGGLGVEVEADQLDQAAKGILAACWLLSRPFRTQLPPDRWRAAQQGG